MEHSCPKHPEGADERCPTCLAMNYGSGPNRRYPRPEWPFNAHPHRIQPVRSFMRARTARSVLAFPIQALKPGQSATITTGGTQVMFAPLWLVIPKHVGRRLHVLDIMLPQGSSSKSLFANRGTIHGLCFRETLTAKTVIHLNWGILDIAQCAQIRVVNVSRKAVDVLAYLVGEVMS